MLKRRIVSWIMVVLFVVMSVPAYADAVQYESQIQPEKVIADFNTGASVMDKGYPTVENKLTRAVFDASVAYDDNAGSLKWTFGADHGILVKIPYDSAWASGYDKLNIRYYTETPGQTVMVHVNEYDTFSGSADKKYWTSYIKTDDEWKVLSINISDIKNHWEVENPEYVYVYFVTNGWNKVTGTVEEFNNGTAHAIAGEKMYIDSMWLGCTDEEQALENKVVADFGVGAEIVDTYQESRLTRAQFNTSVKYDAESKSTLAWTFNVDNGILFKIPVSEAFKADYNSFVIRYYTEIPGQTFNIGINDSYNFGSQAYNAYVVENIRTESGWQEYSVDLESIKSTWEEENPEYLYVVLETKLLGATAVEREEFDSTQMQAISGEKLYIDKIYLDVEDVVEPEPEPDVELKSDKMLVNFNTGATVSDKKYPASEGTLTRAVFDPSVAYEDNTGSLKWTFGADNGIIVKIPCDSAWASGYDKLNIRYYTETPGQTVMVHVNEYDTFSGSSDKKYWTSYITTDNKWKVLSINISDIKNHWEVENPEYVYVYFVTNGWNKVTGTAEDFNNGTAHAIAGETMHIDSMWLGCTDEEQALENKVVADFGVGAEIVDTFQESRLTRARFDSGVKYNADSKSTLAWTFNVDNGILLKIPVNEDLKNGYNSFVIKYYTEIPGQTFNIGINEAYHFGSQTYNTYVKENVRTENGWQEYVIDLESIKGTWEEENPEYLYVVLETKLLGATAVEREEFDNTQMQAISGEKLYIDSIWLENRFKVDFFEANESGTNATVAFEAHKDESVVLIAAVYDGDALAYIVTADSKDNNQILTLDEDLVLENGHTVKFMLWDSLQGMKPYTVAK